MKIKNRSQFIKIIGTFFSLVLFIYLLSRQNWKVVYDLMGQLSILSVFFVFLLYFGGMCANGLRWMVLLKGAEIKVPFFELMKIVFVGAFTSNFLPSTIGGDGVRFLSLLRFTPNKKVNLASLFMDRLLNLLLILAILPFAVVNFIPEVQDIWKKILKDRKTGAGLYPVLNFFSLVNPLFRKGVEYFKSVLSTFKIWLNKPVYLFVAFGAALIASLFSFTGTFIMAKSVLIDVSFWEVIQIAALVYIFSLLPISLNGIGIRELLMTSLYVSLGTSLEQAALLTLATRLLMVMVTSLGAFWLPEQMAEAKTIKDEIQRGETNS